MLEDRDYMRAPDYRESRVSFTVALLIVNAVVFLAECAFCGYPPRFSEDNYFALSLAGMEHGFVWQLLTFQFMHGGLLHLLFNSWAIYVFGRVIEARLGPRKFLFLYFIGGIVGGLLEMLGAFAWPGHFGTSVVGASAGGMALVAAFAVFYSHEPVTIFVYFFPITMRAKYLVWGIASLSALSILLPGSPFAMLLGENVANGAHLGGILVGLLFAFAIAHGGWQWKMPVIRRRPREMAVKRAGRTAVWYSLADKPDDVSTTEFMNNEVDPILEKISAHGIHSLTAREREILEKARKKIGGH